MLMLNNGVFTPSGCPEGVFSKGDKNNKVVAPEGQQQTRGERITVAPQRENKFFIVPSGQPKGIRSLGKQRGQLHSSPLRCLLRAKRSC